MGEPNVAAVIAAYEGILGAASTANNIKRAILSAFAIADGGALAFEHQ